MKTLAGRPSACATVVAVRRALFSAILAVLMLLAALATAPDRAVAASEIKPSEVMHSAALGRDLGFAVYLPPGYAGGAGRYPVLYLLHGHNGNHLQWLNAGHLRETLDRLIEGGAIAPMIVVMPEAGNSWYVDSKAIGGPGDYGTAIAHELVAAIDDRYRTKAQRRFRAVAGLSMGGFGALHLAFTRPFRFAAAASFSGAFWEREDTKKLAAASAERIFDGAFGTPLDRRRFAAADPFGMVDRLAGAADPPAVFLTVGDDDRYGLYADSFRLFTRMRALRLPVEIRITAGDHDWATWAAELPEALRFFDAVFRGRR